MDATPAPGVTCLFTGDDPSSRLGEADVDDGVVVARSGPYDLSGHADVRVEVQRWFGNRDLGEDPGDFFRLEIRHDAASPDVLLEELGSSISQASWTPVNFRVADFVEPGAGVELKVSVADGASTGNIIEAAIDEILFWEPRCEIHDPPP
ncbi:MAG: hypothetical protein GWN73_23110, partial [Actinobacteria bacterium]|nr:hypothetical protein [Actinomycetota bacterium]NIS33229.1 hypothetical protein [Actinomycetota bacterium]NIU68143.1 hypothetical protein [Actinomycetota bacterium]